MQELVECHAGYKYAERPLALQWQGERLPVVEILNQWRDPDGAGFRVLTGDGQLFELFFREFSDKWLINQL